MKKEQSILEQVCTLLAAKWPQDGWAPGVQVANIAGRSFDDAQWYAAIHRYQQASQRTVVCKARGATLREAIAECLLQLTADHRIDAKIAKLAAKLQRGEA